MCAGDWLAYFVSEHLNQGKVLGHVLSFGPLQILLLSKVQLDLDTLGCYSICVGNLNFKPLDVF